MAFGLSRRELARQLERERARNREREGELLNQVLYLSGRPWGMPPTVDEPEPEERELQPVLSALDVLPDEWDAPAEEED